MPLLVGFTPGRRRRPAGGRGRRQPGEPTATLPPQIHVRRNFTAAAYTKSAAQVNRHRRAETGGIWGAPVRSKHGRALRANAIELYYQAVGDGHLPPYPTAADPPLPAVATAGDTRPRLLPPRPCARADHRKAPGLASCLKARPGVSPDELAADHPPGIVICDTMPRSSLVLVN